MKTPWQRATDPDYVKQERRTARKRGARPQINSGRTWSSLRDVKVNSPLGHILIDNKTTEAKSYTITKDDFNALIRDANRTPPGCQAALQVDIQDLRLITLTEAFWDDVLDYIRLLEARLDDAQKDDG